MDDLAHQDWKNEQIATDKLVHSALLMLYVDTVSDLPVSYTLAALSFFRGIQSAIAG